MLTACCLINKAVGQHFCLQKYTVHDGLADSYVLGLYQDSQDFLWVGTVNGLSRFDGKEFINYGYAEGLPNLRVDLIYEDHNKRLWAGTRSGIVEIRGRKCITYPVSDSQQITYVFGIKELHNELLALTDKGVYRFGQQQWKKIKLVPGFENYHCRSIIDTRQGRIINYGNYLVTQNRNGQYHIAGKYPLDEPYYNTMVQYGKRLYMSMDGKLLLLKQPDTLSLFQRVLHNKNLFTYYYDSRDRFWISTEEDGLMVSKKGSTEIITDTIRVAYNLVSKIYEDRQGNMWIACLDGLLKIRDVSHTTFRAVQDPLLDRIWNLAPINDTTLMVCTTDGLLQYKREKLTRMPLTYASESARTGIAMGVPDSWCRDAKGNTWLAMRQKKLYLLQHNAVKDVSHFAAAHNGLYWRIAFNNGNKKVYLCTDTLFYGDEHGLQPVVDAGNGAYIIKPRAIHTFSNGNMLVNAARNKFLLITPRHQVRDVSAAIGIKGSNNDLVFLTEPSGKFWIGYNGGLLRFSWNNGHVPEHDLQVTTQQGLPNDAVHAITMDAYNRLWAITSAGLVVIETSQTRSGNPVIHRLSEETGIISNQWLEGKLLTDGAGYIWLSLSNSVYRFNPQLVQFDNTPPSVTIEDIQLNLQPAKWNGFTDSLSGYRQLPRAITLPHYLNNLSISYRAPCYNGISGLEYSYQLNGTDSAWSTGTKNNFVSFVKLPPGIYHFKVRARTSNTAWGKPAIFTFIIKKPYWETWAFQLAVIALATIILAFLFRKRIQQIQRKTHMQQQMRELELKALRAQMNPHFIYNALNSIQALVLDNQADKATLYISKFGRLLRQVLSHSEKNCITLAEELEALELYIQLEQLRLNVPLQYRIVPDAGINIHEEGIPPLILQPFAENALWHGLSRKEGQKTLDIVLHTGNDWLIVEIIDNGIGRKQAAVQKRTKSYTPSKGIEITSRRIKEYNQQPGERPIEIIDLYNDSGQSSGTKVILHIKRWDPDA